MLHGIHISNSQRKSSMRKASHAFTSNAIPTLKQRKQLHGNFCFAGSKPSHREPGLVENKCVACSTLVAHKNRNRHLAPVSNVYKQNRNKQQSNPKRSKIRGSASWAELRQHMTCSEATNAPKRRSRTSQEAVSGGLKRLCFRFRAVQMD